LKNNWKVLEENYNNNVSITDRILNIRGIENKEQFPKPKDEDINSPWLLSNMQEAVDKIIYAIKNKLRIGIYAD